MPNALLLFLHPEQTLSLERQESDLETRWWVRLLWNSNGFLTFKISPHITKFWVMFMKSNGSFFGLKN